MAKWRVEVGMYLTSPSGESGYVRTSTHIVEAASPEEARKMCRASLRRVAIGAIEPAPEDAPVGQVGRLVNQAGHYRGY